MRKSDETQAQLAEKSGGEVTDTPPVPAGLQSLLRLASVDSEFEDDLVQRRDGVAEILGVSLTPSEVAILRAVPAEQLRGMARGLPAPSNRRTFLRQTARAAVLLLGGAAIPGAIGCKPQSETHKPAEPSPEPAAEPASGAPPRADVDAATDRDMADGASAPGGDSTLEPHSPVQVADTGSDDITNNVSNVAAPPDVAETASDVADDAATTTLDDAGTADANGTAALEAGPGPKLEELLGIEGDETTRADIRFMESAGGAPIDMPTGKFNTVEWRMQRSIVVAKELKPIRTKLHDVFLENKYYTSRCYRRYWDRHGEPVGKVGSVDIHNDAVGKGFAECLAKAIASWRFPPSAGGQIRVTWRFTE